MLMVNSTKISAAIRCQQRVEDVSRFSSNLQSRIGEPGEKQEDESASPETMLPGEAEKIKSV